MSFNMRLVFTLFLLFQAGCKESGKNSGKQQNSPAENSCIERILAADDSLGSVRNEASRKIPVSTSIKHYKAALEELNFTGCPPEFTEAFKKHRQAWEAMLRVTDKYPNLRGELHEVFDTIALSKDSVEFKKRLEKIWSTWEMVEKHSKP